MFIQILIGTGLLLVNITFAAVAAMLLEWLFARSHNWLLREPHRPKLVLVLAGVSLWILGVVTVGVWVWAFGYHVLGVFSSLEESVYFSLVCFTTLGFGDVLLHHPYDSFATSVQRFIEQAAADPAVLAIKQTLYRTSGDSPIIDALVEAAQAGKQVLALVEIKARFDEQANIAWARKLEKAGCHVVYGMLGLKTHCKLSLVVREEETGLRRYVHIGTGNYNPKTARMYEDMGLLTSNNIITDDVARLFNHLSGMAQETHYKRLLVAPHGVRRGLIENINHEIENHRAGLPARVRIKVNSIVDEAVTDAMYRASQAGVPVDLWVRGICSVRPGVPGLSENIRVRSILGRFLEHSRIYWFANGGTPKVYIGSADLMHRNLDRRVEVLVPLPSETITDRTTSILDTAFAPSTQAWVLDAEGEWAREAGTSSAPTDDLQEILIGRHHRHR